MSRSGSNALLRGLSPHMSAAFSTPSLIALAAGTGYGAFLWANGSRNVSGIFFSTALVLISAVLIGYNLHINRHTACRIDCGIISVTSPRGEKRLKLSCLDRVECSCGLLSGYSGIRRVRIYSQVSGKPWLSFRLAGKDWEALLDALFPPCGQTGRTVSGKYSSAVYALISEKTVIPVVVSLEFTLLSGESLVMNLFACVMLTAALLNMLISALSSGRCSLIRHGNYFCVTSGIAGGRKIFLPESSVVGAMVRRSPGELLCGTGSLRLMTESGKKILCIRMLPEREFPSAVFGLLDAEGNACVSFSDLNGLSRRYAVRLGWSLFCSFLTACFSFRTGETALRFPLCLALSGFTVAAVGYTAGFVCASRFGLKVSPSCVLSAGIDGIGAEYVYLRRCKVAGLRASSPLFQRMNDRCRAGILTGAGDTGVWSDCVPYRALMEFAGRFC
ncbi:MAG: hypothetical protein IJM51_06835 [Clostridia bacterium]|nr:hypothetical protein [Clostridia bacterium]